MTVYNLLNCRRWKETLDVDGGSESSSEPQH